ncbi:Integrase (fragment) [uncultured Pleomorphomonas sp.]|uniref:Integrase n=2 Tax=uncultured Pleomorphomonas sp. TaxID=442121 RepID=A0A212L8Y5_9HYPH
MKDKAGHDEVVRAFVYRTEKTGEWVTLRLLPALERTIEAGPCSDLTFITGPAGKPLTKESFGNQFRQWCNDAGVKKSAHGLRKLAATTAANNGATAAQLRSMFAWSNDRMASHYTRSADRVRLSLEASDLIAGTPAEQSIPAPRGKVRARARKDK